MTTSDQAIAVQRSVHVPLDPEQAFALFTARMGAFWPATHQIGAAPFTEVVVEPRPGGRWFERSAAGMECDWGRVAAWEPPGRVVLVWQISGNWTFDPELETDVEVTFTADGPGRTRVDLTHHHLERYGEQAGAMRDTLGGPGGWPLILDGFSAAA